MTGSEAPSGGAHPAATDREDISGEREESGRRRRLSTFVLAATVIVGTGLLLWGADLLARIGAESLLARNIQAATGVPTRPEVDVRGAFFLPQVIEGRYDTVEITIDGLAAGPLRIEHLKAELTGVHLPFHDVLVQNSVPIYIERSVEHATLNYEDLNHYLDVTGRPLEVGGAPDGETVLTGTVGILGREVSASTRAELGVKEGSLTVRPTQLDTDTALDRASRLLLSQRFTFVVPLDPLPFGQRLTELQGGEKGLLIEAGGEDVVVRP